MMFTEPLARAATGPSSVKERLVAGFVALALIGAAAAWSLSGRGGFAFSPEFFGGYAAALTMAALFAALLLVFRANMIGDRAAALVAASFVYCVPLIAGYALTFPAAGPGWLAHPEASGWMSFGWRLGWPVAVLWYALRPPQPRGNLPIALLGAACWSAAIIALAFSGWLPLLYGPDHSYLPPLFVANGLTALLTIAALVCLWRKPPVTTIDTWLSVALGLLGAGSVLILFTPGRFAPASDAVRAINIASSLILAFALLYEFQRLMWRRSALDRYLTMAQYSPSIVYLLDAAGVCIYVNRRWEDVTGQPAQEALGTGWRAVIHPDDLETTGATWVAALHEQRTHEIELRYRSAGGSYRWYLATATPTFGSDGAIDGWFGVAMDVDAQHRHAERLTEMYAREHSIAQTLQSAFIPPLLPHVDGVDFRAVYRPALREAELGGDWYDAFVLPDGRIALSIGDVAGHGIDAALAMVRLRETLRAVTGLIDVDPGSLLKMADRSFMATHADVIATAAFAVYDPVARRLVYARAGHPCPALVRNGVARFLESHPGVPLGVQAESRFVSQTIDLEPGDELIWYTDGLTEMTRDLVAGERRLIDVLERYSGDVERVVDETLGGEQRDDVALLRLAVLHEHDQTSWHFECDDAGGAGDARFAFVKHLARRKLDPSLVSTAELIFGELVSNVVRHAPGPIEIELIERAERLLLAVRDRGPGFQLETIDLPQDPLSEGGRGLYLMSKLGSPPVVMPRPGGGNEVVVALVPSAVPA
jgi:PAS domain S-box-containing protein